MPDQIVRIEDVEHFHWKLSESDARVSFSGNNLSLAAAVELAIIDAHIDDKQDGLCTSIRASSNGIWSLLRASRWPGRRKRLKLGDAAAAVLVLPRDSRDLWWTDRLRELLHELSTNGFPTDLARGLTGAVAEMVDNVWQHSEASDPGLLAYQVRRRKFAFSVADTGIGVMASLRTNPRYRWLTSSMEAIRYAIRPGVSRQEVGGMGFPSLMHALAELWGNARLRTGEASLLIDRTAENRRKDYLYLPYLPGLHVSVRCALDPPTV